MKHCKPLILLAALMGAGGAQAQPFSESMAECAAFYQNAAQWVETKASSDKLIMAARRFANAAVIQSGAEGTPLAEPGMWQKIDGKTEVWEAKGQAFFMTEEFRDWASYCRSFASDRGIALE